MLRIARESAGVRGGRGGGGAAGATRLPSLRRHCCSKQVCGGGLVARFAEVSETVANVLGVAAECGLPHAALASPNMWQTNGRAPSPPRAAAPRSENEHGEEVRLAFVLK